MVFWELQKITPIFSFVLIISDTTTCTYNIRYDNLARSLAMMEDELRRADERVKNAESRVRFDVDDVGDDDDDDGDVDDGEFYGDDDQGEDDKGERVKNAESKLDGLCADDVDE